MCFESIRIDEDLNTDIKSVVFYGLVKDQRFTHIGVPSADFPSDSHEFWLCSQPRDSQYIRQIDFDDEEFNVFDPNIIDASVK